MKAIRVHQGGGPLASGWLPPTLNLDCPVDECDRSFIRGRGDELDIEHAVST